MSDMAQRLAKLTPAQRQLLEARLRQQPTVAQPIAIVGMACRLPGVVNCDEFWQMIVDNRDAFREIPEDRWGVDEFYDPDPDAAGKMSTRRFAMIDGVAEFDSVFFGIAPREASRMDPQQRLLLEVTWEALENAGFAPDRIAGAPVGVFVGIGGTDYSKVPWQFDNYLELIDAHVGTGNALSIASNRISYILDLRGPSLSVDTACSSGLLGVHLAAQSLRNNECDMALAGGVNLILSPEVTIAFSKARMLSPTGYCRPFDSRADGYVRGEGCAMLVLKRLTDATRHGDRVLAVIRGSAANQDGRTSGITAPNSLSQQACIQAALASAGLDASAYDYIEAHGTGTPLGDPIEIQSLSKILKRANASQPPCYVASVKGNIGHTETVSGVAGLIKVVLMMQHDLIPAQTGLESLNENIQLVGSRIEFPREHHPWQGDGSRIAGVSSFGFGGTNTHVIVESATFSEEVPSSATERPKHVLAISAKSKSALTEVAQRYARALDTIGDDQVPDFCHEANFGRAHFHHRSAMVTGSRDQLQQQLLAVAEEKRAAGVKSAEVRLGGRPRMAFLFTGQGAQYHQMARGLYDVHPQFRAVMDECTEVLREYRRVPLVEVLFGSDHPQLVNETEYTQPALFAVEYALARLWQSWGIEPTIMLGHSVGEYVAACIAGVFDLPDGLRLIAKRAELMQQMPPNGAMAVVFADRDRVTDAVRPYGGRVAIATANGPENNVISGETQAIESLVEEFGRVGIGTQRLTVSHAFHSPLMDPMLDEFEAFAATLSYDRPKIPIVANRTGEIVETAAFDASYWRDHLRNAVEFARGMGQLHEHGVDAYIEIGPAAALLGMGKRCVPKSAAAWVPSLRKGRNDWDTLLTAVADVYLLGADIRWDEFDRPWQRVRIQLPTYPFKRTRYWMEGVRSEFGAARGKSLHPLLGNRRLIVSAPHVFEASWSLDAPKYLCDHAVQGSPLVAAAVYLEQGLAVARQVFGPGSHALHDISIQKGMFLPHEGHRVVQVTVSPELSGRASFDCYSIDPSTASAKDAWVHHVTGTIAHAEAEEAVTPPSGLPNQAEFEQQIIKKQTRDEFYQLMSERQLDYGPMFQALGMSHLTDCEATSVLELDPSVEQQLDHYQLHPVVGDALLQTAAGVVPFEADGSYSPYTYVPVRMAGVRIFDDPRKAVRTFARRTSEDNSPSPETVEADTYLLGPADEVLVAIQGLVLQRAGQPSRPDQQQVNDWLYHVHWESSQLRADATGLSGQHVVVLADSHGLARSLVSQLTEAGAVATLVRPGTACQLDDPADFQIRSDEPEDWSAMLMAAARELGPIQHVVYLWALDTEHPERTTGDGLTDASLHTGIAPLRLLQQLARVSAQSAQAWFVTQCAQAVSRTDGPLSVQQTPLWGFGRVAANEHPEFKVRLVDIGATEDDEAIRTAAGSLVTELAAAADENQLARRGADRFVARLQPMGEAGPATEGMSVPAAGDIRLRLSAASSLDELRYEQYLPPEPGDGQVAIQVRATGLNFSDVLKALGLYPGIRDKIVPLGIECAGVVTAVGPGVDRFEVGDEVLGVSPYSFATRTVTADYAVVHKPADLDFEEAATIPITFLTAYHALCRLARLRRGERILIHAGAGGVGLAAIQIAQHLGAEIFATAGSDVKREYLSSLGVPHVLNSRTTDFAEEILQRTNRQGIDVVLNSLPGEAIPKSLGILRAYGRFLEIGKTDIYSNTMIGLLPFQDNLSYFAIDLDRMLRQRPQEIRELFDEVMDLFKSKALQPIPFTQFSTQETIEAFRYMAQRKNIGKVVVSMAERAADADPAPPLIRDDATYLVTGGLGALGLKVAAWLMDQGATHLALMARRPASDKVLQRLADWKKSGAHVAVLRGDVSDRKSLTAALEELPASFPPLRGVFHAAGVLADGVIYDLTPEQFHIPLQPKVQGTWNLFTCLRDRPVDFVVEFSSVASVLGSPGQSNYAAANAFLDGMATYFRQHGIAGLSINWGPWADAGMAAEAGRDQQLAARGMSLLPEDKALEALELLLRRDVAQAAVMSVQWEQLLAASAGRIPPLLRDVAAGITLETSDSAEDRRLREALVRQSPEQRQQSLQEYFVENLAAITGLESAEIDLLAPLNSMGLDSLMAIELKNKIEKRLQITIPMAAFMHEPSVSTLAGHASAAFEGPPEADQLAASASNGQSPSAADIRVNGVSESKTPKYSSTAVSSGTSAGDE